jgi:hypothetical protein
MRLQIAAILLPVLGLFSQLLVRALVPRLVVQLSAESIRSLGITAAEIRQAAQSPAAFLEMGRLLYPRFFTRENGLASAHPWPAYAPREYPRVGFLLLNAGRTDVILPLRDPPPAFAHGEDVIVRWIGSLG